VEPASSDHNRPIVRTLESCWNVPLPNGGFRSSLFRALSVPLGRHGSLGGSPHFGLIVPPDRPGDEIGDDWAMIVPLLSTSGTADFLALLIAASPPFRPQFYRPS
jgi:hypothetical protein